MALSSETSSIPYTSNGSQVEYPVPFRFLNDEDLLVERAPADDPTDFSPLTLGEDYTVDGAGEDEGGTVTLTEAADTDDTIRISREVPLTQSTSFGRVGPFTPKSHEDALDKAMMAAQQLKRRVDEVREELLDAIADFNTGGAAFGFLTLLSPLPSPNPLQSIFRSTGRRVQISEHGRDWKYVTDADEVRDMRDFLSDAQKTQLELGNPVNATGAMQDIFEELEDNDGKVFTPFNASLYEIEETCEYIGDPGLAFEWGGDLGASRGAVAGSGFKWVGARGGTMFDLRGANNSTISNLFFNGDGLPKYILRLREYRNDDVTLLAGSANLTIRSCTFYKPDDTDIESACVAIGQTTSGQTFQCDTMRFHDCVIHGSGGALGGYGIRTLEGGNCKNFGVWGTTFLELRRGIHTECGWLFVQGCTGLNIGYDAGNAGCLVHSSADAIFVLGVGLESGDSGYSCRLAESTQANSLLVVDGVYGAFATPADDYGVKAAGPSIVRTSKLGPNYKQSAMLAWAANTLYTVGKERHNDSGKAYRCITQGTSASSGGPTGTASDITDGSAHWEYLAPKASEVTKINVNPISAEVENCGFTTQSASSIKTAPVYDNNNNFLTDGDYAKLSAANNRVWCRGNVSSGSGGLSGVLDNRLRDTISGWYDNIRDQILTDNNTSGVVVVSDVGGRYVCTVPYSVFAAAGAGQVTIGRLNYLHQLDSVVGRVTAALTGGGVMTPAVSVGLLFGPGGGDIDVDGLLTAFAADATGVFGRADADYGALFEAGVGWISPVDHLNEIRVKLTVGAGTIASLSAGSITFTIGHKRLSV